MAVRQTICWKKKKKKKKTFTLKILKPGLKTVNFGSDPVITPDPVSLRTLLCDKKWQEMETSNSAPSQLGLGSSQRINSVCFVSFKQACSEFFFKKR